MRNVVAKVVTKVKEVANKVVNGDSHFLAVGVTLIIVVVIAAIFKDQLKSIFTGLFGTLDTTVDGLFTP